MKQSIALLAMSLRVWTATPDKTNEIKGIPILLKTLSIKDKIITIDAMGTQKGIANLIRLKQAHYVLA